VDWRELTPVAKSSSLWRRELSLTSNRHNVLPAG
jgi:hypothetical protein